MSVFKIQVGDFTASVVQRQASRRGFRSANFQFGMQRIIDIASAWNLPWTLQDQQGTLDLHSNENRAASGA
eukprot:12920520-Prorocentrum_lima.AAC.1